MEFLIERTDGEWFDLSLEEWPKVLHPNSYPFKAASGYGEYSIEVDDCLIEINYEIVGFQVIFHGEMPHAKALQIVEEILENITRFISQSGKAIDLSGDLSSRAIRFD